MAKGIAHLGIIFTLGIFTGNSHAVSISDLLITEIMVNPSALPDSRGEWFELYNPTDQEVNLEGISFGDDSGNRHRFESDLLILPGEYLTLARSGDPGFLPDYVYDDFILSNSGDEIVLRNGLTELLRLDYDADFDQAGHSRWLAELPMLIENFDLSFAQLIYGYGDVGSPGSSGKVGPAVSTVSLPATAWLLVSGLLSLSLAILLPRLYRSTRRIPVTYRSSRSRRSCDTRLTLSHGSKSS
jgi:hypothetical protein